MEPLTSNELKPTQNQTRINALDVIRGIALLGILLMNINGMGLPFSYEDPSILGHTEGLNFSVWFVNELFLMNLWRRCNWLHCFHLRFDFLRFLEFEISSMCFFILWLLLNRLLIFNINLLFCDLIIIGYR